MEFKWNTIGHGSVKQYFERLIAQNLFRSHAFLFVGPEHVGKTTFVDDLLKMFLCENIEHRPCNKCQHCTHLAKSIHPDVYRVTRQEESKSIIVEDIRSVIEQLQSGSFFRSKKLCVIEPVDALSNGAANALLKTLEEPSGETFFFFVTAREDKVPPTIRSRCQTIRMYPLRDREVGEALLEQNVPDDQARELSRFCQGRLGLAFGYVGDSTRWEGQKMKVSNWWKLLFSRGYEKSGWYKKKDLLPLLSVISLAHEALIWSLGLEQYRSYPWIRDNRFPRNTSEAVPLLSEALGALRLEDQNANSKMIIDFIHTKVRSVV